jgi:hypothetical protein
MFKNDRLKEFKKSLEGQCLVLPEREDPPTYSLALRKSMCNLPYFSLHSHLGACFLGTKPSILFSCYSVIYSSIHCVGGM